MNTDKDKPAETGEAKQPGITPPAKPSVTATPERQAAAAKANTAKKPAVTVTSTAPKDVKTHDVKLSDVAPKVAAKVKEAKEAKAKEVEPEKVDLKSQVEPAVTPDFAAMTTVDELVGAYNSMVTTAGEVGVKKVTTVKSFIDVKTGKLACERLHAAIQKAVNPTAKPKSAKAASKEKTDMTKTTKKTAKKTAKTAKTKTAKKAKGTGTPRSKYDPASKISWIGKENPYREGSGRFERVELLRKSNGKTVDTYLKNGGRGSTLSHCVGAKLVKVG